MLNILNGLTWQFQALIGEAFLSLVLGLWLFQRGWQRGPSTIAWCLAWNIIAMTLFLTGGANASWQHIAYFAWFVLDSAMVTTAGLMRTKHESTQVGFTQAFFGGLLAYCMIALLVTG